MKKLLFLLLLIVAAYFLWRWWHSDAEVARGQELFYDRLWVDHLPRNESDTIQITAAVTEQPVGVFQAASAWKGAYELFRYQPRGDGKIDLVYPASGAREQARYHAWRCHQKDQETDGKQKFDFCLEIEGASRGVKRYYSLAGWEIGSRSLDKGRADAARLF